jgi:FkbM family methyltransferase
MTVPYSVMTPGLLDKAVIAATSRLPGNWVGLRLAIGLRRIVTMRHRSDRGFDVERWGLRMRLHPRYNGCEKNLLFTPQMYEAPERAELVSEIDKAKGSGRTFVFVDIGANVGLFSLFVASYAGRNAKIIAIEPEPRNLCRLRFNVAANLGVPIQVIALALGKSEGRVVVKANERDRGGTFTRPVSQHDQAGTVYAECRPLLEVLRQEEVTYTDALKIDVEGAEDEILAAFFANAPEELWPRLIIIEDSSNAWRIDLFSLLAERGYRIGTRTKLNVMMRR